MNNLTKRDLVIQISNETGMAQKDVVSVVQRLLDHITENLAKGQSVELRNFGVFSVKFRKARVGRNPRSPEHDIPIASHMVVRFSSGKEMKAKVSQQFHSLLEQSNNGWDHAASLRLQAHVLRRE